MNIVDKIIELANTLDLNNKFAEADVLTRIASEVANQKIANPVNMNKMVGDQNRENNTQMKIKNTLQETSTLKKQAPIQASDDDEDDKREAGYTSLTTFKNDQLTTNKTNKDIGKVVNTVDRLKSSSSNRKANMVNLTGLMNQQKQTNFVNKQIDKTVQQIGNMKANSAKDTDEKIGEREEEEDKKAISLTTLPTQQKQQNSTQNSIQRSVNRVDRMKEVKTQ
jgi:ADP-ribose pyrophosphatase YjhB (NUDIX family)